MSAGPGLVVLAAGASTRLGQSKALVRLHGGPGGTALELLVAAGGRLGDPRPLIVAGRDASAITDLLGRQGPEERSVELVENRNWRAGRTGSLCCAVERRMGRDLCIAPIDVPLVPGEVFAALAAEWARVGSPARGWLAPSLGQSPPGADSATATLVRHGHPVLVGKDLLADLKRFPPGRPLADLRREADPLLALPVRSPAILDNLDTPEDLARLRERLAPHFPPVVGTDSS